MAWDKKWGENRKKKRQKRRDLGLCVSCGIDADGKSKCDACREKNTKRQRELREKRKEQGFCQNCGNVKVKKGQYYCDDCIAKKCPSPPCKTSGCENLTPRNRQHCEDCHTVREAEKQSCPISFKHCIDCNSIFTVKGNLKTIRCKGCQHERIKKKATQRNREKMGLKELNRICVNCGKPYKTYNTNKSTCSTACSKRLMKRRENNKRRATQHGSKHIEKVDIAVLYLRDGGRCQLDCKKKLNLKRVVPHRMAATIDHIMPLSQGGEHSYKNTQLACFMCNSLKGNGYVNGGEQLKLIG